jgi:hypothetical protein
MAQRTSAVTQDQVRAIVREELNKVAGEAVAGAIDLFAASDALRAAPQDGPTMSALLVELYEDFFELADVVEDFQVRSQHFEKCLRQVCGGLPVVRDERIHQLAADGERRGHFDLPKFLKGWVFGLGHQSSPSLVTGVQA